MATTQKPLHSKIDDLHAKLDKVQKEMEDSIEADLKETEQSLIDDSFDKLTDKLKDIPEFVQEHSAFFFVFLVIIILWTLLAFGTFILTFINTGFICIVLNKINQIDLLILEKK